MMPNYSLLQALSLRFLAVGCLTFQAIARPATPYTVVLSTQTMGSGGIDYVFADNDQRRLYVPRGDSVLVFDLDSLKPVAEMKGTGGRGVAIDSQSHHGFSSSRPISMWDTQTMTVIKKIEVEGGPDGILFEPASRRIYVFSHRAPNATVIDPKDGTVVGTIDLGGAPEQAASDGKGRLYVDIEDEDKVAVVDVNTLKVVTYFTLNGKGGTPAGLGLDAKNGILFVMCRNPNTCVILSAADGKHLATLPIGKGTDGGGFNPKTMEAFSSQGDGTLTIIKETSPTTFEVEQTVTTKPRAKTSTLDTKNDRIVVIATEPVSSPAGATSPGAAREDRPNGGPQDGPRRDGGGRGGPAFLDILVVGR